MLGTIPHFVAAVTWASLARALCLSDNTTAAVVERCWSYYQRYVLFVFENIAGREVRRVRHAHTRRAQLYAYGDVNEMRNERVLYICNHQSSVDWVVVDMLAQRTCNNMGVCRWPSNLWRAHVQVTFATCSRIHSASCLCTGGISTIMVVCTCVVAAASFARTSLDVNCAIWPTRCVRDHCGWSSFQKEHGSKCLLFIL
jgi:hypothetical protein